MESQDILIASSAATRGRRAWYATATVGFASPTDEHDNNERRRCPSIGRRQEQGQGVVTGRGEVVAAPRVISGKMEILVGGETASYFLIYFIIYFIIYFLIYFLTYFIIYIIIYFILYFFIYFFIYFIIYFLIFFLFSTYFLLDFFFYF